MLKKMFLWINRKSDLSKMAFGTGLCLVPLFLNCEKNESGSTEPDKKSTLLPQPTQTVSASEEAPQALRVGTDDVPEELFVCIGGSTPCPLVDPKIKTLIENCEKTQATDCRSKSKVEEFIKVAGIPEIVEKPECLQMSSLVPMLLRQSMSVESETLVTIQPKSIIDVTALIGNWYQVKHQDKNGWVQKTQNGEELLVCAEAAKVVASEKVFHCFLDQIHYCKIKKLSLGENCVDKFFLPATSFLSGTKVTVSGRGCYWNRETKIEYARIKVEGGQECYLKASILSAGKLFRPCF